MERVFSDVSIDTACIGRRGIPRMNASYTAGVVWGHSANDYMVVAVFDCAWRQLVNLDRYQGISWVHQRNRILALDERWSPIAIFSETGSVDNSYLVDLQRMGLSMRSFNTTAQSKGPLIESLALAMVREEITLLDDPVLKSELGTYAVEVLPSGNLRFGVPIGLHDDTVIATALSWYGVQLDGPVIRFAD